MYESPNLKKYKRESDKQFKIVFGAAVIIFRELHKMTDEQIKKITDAADHIWSEIKYEGDLGIIMTMCERETGIEMKLRGKSYKQVDVFSEDIRKWNLTRTMVDYIYDTIRPWSANGYIACILIAVHRILKWGKTYHGKPGKLQQLFDDIENVRGEWRSAYQYEELLDKKYNMQYEIK